MKSDIRKYISLRDALVQERAQLENRLREITEALGEARQNSASSAAPTTAAQGRPAQAVQSGRGRGRGRRAGGGLSLREAVLQVTSGGPRTKEEILDGIKQLGYKFQTNNPLNSLGVILYGKNPRFKNDGGRFSVSGSAQGGAAKAQSASAGRQGAGRKRRTMSPEARERIAAAQRARWAKAKSGK